MNFVNFEVNGKDYKLCLTTRTMCELESKLGCNPIDILVLAADGHLPKVSEMVLVLHAAAQKYNHGIKLDDCYNIFDDYIAEGNAFTDFINIMMQIFEVSGLIAKNAGEENPNAIAEK